MRRLVLVASLIAVLAVLIGLGNYVFVHRDMRAAIDSDPRNAGLVFYGYHDKLIVPSAVVIDLRDVSNTNSPADVFRLLLQFASKKKDNNYDRVFLSFRGERRFILTGEYFKTLGLEYGTQNPVYTMRTLPENVFNVDGTPAFETWTGGLLGVLGRQMEDFNEFHRRWYIESLSKSGT